MPLTANALPVQPPSVSVPFDAALDLSAGVQTMTATGLMAASSPTDIGAGMMHGLMVLDISNLKVSATDESYKFALLGSNDAAFANGNVELLAFHDFGVRQFSPLLGATPAIPPTGLAGSLIYLPFSNLMQRIVYRYARGYVAIAGTAPTVTFRSWIAPKRMVVP
ncbi:hypothetical protein ABIE86_005181 [Bradyrhizobium diazoefficiens]